MNLIRSIGFALEGLKTMLLKERNFKIHCVAFICVCIFSATLRITNLEWIAVLLASGLVLASEMFNTAIEKLCNLYSSEKMPQIKIIKDVAAACVLLSCVLAVVIAFLIFPKYLA